MKKNSANQRIRIHSLPFVVGTFSEVTEHIFEGILSKKSQIILPCSLNDLASISQDQATLEKYRAVDICTTDGMPLVWLARLKTHQPIERVYGPDLMMALCRKLNQQNVTQFLYGSSTKTLKALEKQIYAVAPKTKLFESISPRMGKLSEKEALTFINHFKKFKPDVLWIGISSPAQIEFAAQVKSALPKTTILCVGAAFDFVSKSKRNAPTWMKRIGLEWLFRLLNEPKRLWKRYLFTIPKFLLLHGLELIFNP